MLGNEILSHRTTQLTDLSLSLVMYAKKNGFFLPKITRVFSIIYPDQVLNSLFTLQIRFHNL